MTTSLLKTGFFLALLTVLFVVVGGLIGGQTGMVMAFLIALAMNGLAFWNSDTMVLRMHGAREVDSATAPEYYGIVESLARNAGLPMPRVYVMHSAQPNAFATGRSPERSAVCASTGLLDQLNREEVAAVMAHELAHIKNRDTLIMTIAATMAGAISMLANMLQFSMLFGGNRDNRLGLIGSLAAIILAPMAAMLVQMAISRSREYAADRIGAEICGNPLWLASALRRIQSAAHRVPMESAERVPASAHMFIINPLTGRGMDNLFSTHPNTENRIAQLEELARQMGSDSGMRMGNPSGGFLAGGRRMPGPRGSRRGGPWG